MAAVLYTLFFAPLVLGACIGAILFGGRAERSGAICLLIANVGAEVVIYLGGAHYPGRAIFLIDFLLAAAFLVIAIRYSSLWLGGAMIIQGAALYIHALALMGDEVSNRLYILSNNWFTLIMLGCISLGTTARVLKRRRSGVQLRAPLAH